jgi:hypothetical protein
METGLDTPDSFVYYKTDSGQLAERWEMAEGKNLDKKKVNLICQKWTADNKYVWSPVVTYFPSVKQQLTLYEHDNWVNSGVRSSKGFGPLYVSNESWK